MSIILRAEILAQLKELGISANTFDSPAFSPEMRLDVLIAMTQVRMAASQQLGADKQIPLTQDGQPLSAT